MSDWDRKSGRILSKAESWILVLLFLMPAVSVIQPLASTRAQTGTGAPAASDPSSVTQVPTVVNSGQPVFVFAQESGQISVTITVSCKNNSSLFNCSNLSRSLPSFSYSLIPFPGAVVWYFAIIPGLPAKTVVVNRPCFVIKTCHVNVTISSSVSYTVGSSPGSYTVQQSTVSQNFPPIVGAFVTQDMLDSSTMAETYGLSPNGWVVGPSDSIAITAFAFSPSGIQSLGESYSQSGGSQIPLVSTKDPAQGTLDSAVTSLNSVISSVNTLTGSSFNSLVDPIAIQDATIPPTPLRNYVTFEASSFDKSGNSATSPQGFYYIVNTQAATKVLAIDPHVKLWVLLQNLHMYSGLVRSDLGYQLPTSLGINDSLLLEVSQLLQNFEAAQFHYWNLLGSSYNLQISFPDSSVANVLQTFHPNVVYLSDLSLGFKSQQGTPSQFFDWDLNDATDKNGTTILSEIISYTQQHNSGLIGSAGVLSDWEVGCPGTQTKVGSRGDVGNQISVANPINEQTLAPMFGMPLLPAFEYARDQAASGGPACQAIGSIPLLVPNLPWNGTLVGPSSFAPTILNKNPSIMAGLTGLNIVMPSYQSLGYNAANTVGWQLSLPGILASKAWSSVNAVRNNAQVQQYETSLAGLSSNITGASVVSTGLDCALNQGLAGVYGSFAGSEINGTGINLSISIPCGGPTWSKFVSLPISQLASLWPVQIAALSPDYSAGVVTYDKYFVQNGYRSVYLSFPVEASDQNGAVTMMENAISWALAWHYQSVTRLGGVVIASGSTSQTLRSAVNGQILTSMPILANEQGNSSVTFVAPAAGKYELLVASPSSGIGPLKLSMNAESSPPMNLGNNVTQSEVSVSSPGTVVLYLTSDASSILTPMYLEVVQPSTVTTTTSTTSTISTSTTSTSTTSTTSTTSSTTSATTTTTTTTSSSSSSVTTSSKTSGTTASTSTTSPTSTTTSSGGGIPEFPYQAIAITAFVVLIVVSFLLVRRDR